jgi:indolepyruvate ferredoxin oxidoreductase beta subunit
LAKLRPWRRRSFRFAEEQQAIGQWLDAIARAAPKSQALAREIAECARLLKGYSDTYRRGRDNYRRIMEAGIVPLLARPDADADLLKKMREAALTDPDGGALGRAIDAAAAALRHREAAE